jgi:hypothetical protein
VSPERTRARTRAVGVQLGAIAVVAAVGIGAFYWHERRVRADREARRSQWSIGIFEGPSPLHLGPVPPVTNPVVSSRDVTDVRAEFVADPFMLQRGSTWYLFFEVMDVATGHGYIGLATSSDGRSFHYERIVLREPFHLSYPYVFEDGSDVYMVPETYEAGAVRLYRATRFPEEWTLDTTLLSGKPFVDSSLVRYHDKWWLFTSTPENSELLLYYADALRGPWTPHPANPIVRRNLRIARPGGRVLAMSDHVLRFAQDDEHAYGRQVFAFEIRRLDETGYDEAPAGDGPVVGPSGSGWNRDRMHTVDAHRTAPDRWIACVDGKGPISP